MVGKAGNSAPKPSTGNNDQFIPTEVTGDNPKKGDTSVKPESDKSGNVVAQKDNTVDTEALENNQEQQESQEEVLDNEKVGKFQKILAERGKKTYDAATIEISKRDLEQAAHGAALDATKAWEAQVKAKVEKALPTFTKIDKALSNTKGINLVYGLAKGVFSLPVNIGKSVAHTIKLNEYKKATTYVAENTGSLDAIQYAVEEVNNNKKVDKTAILDKVNERLDTEEQTQRDAILERVKIAKEMPKYDNEMLLTPMEKERNAAIKEAFTQYALALATNKKVEGGEKGEEAAKKETPYDKLMEDLQSLKNDGRMTAKDINNSNFGEVAKQMEEDLAGVFYGKGGKANHKEALKAIDEYVDKNLNLTSAQNIDVGLAVNDVWASATFVEKSLLHHGLVTGITVGILGGLSSSITSVAKSKVVQGITNSSIVGWAAKTVLAAGIGAVKGGVSKRNSFRYGNVKDALSGEDSEFEKGKIGIMNVEKATERMKEMSKEGIKDVDSYLKAVELIAELRARNEVQYEGLDKNKNKQLLGFDGRENIEVAKVNMFKEMNALRKQLQKAQAEFDPAKLDTAGLKEGESIEEFISRMVSEKADELRGDIQSAKKKQALAITGAAIKTGLIAGAAAGTISFLTNRSKIIEEYKALKAGTKRWDGLHVVDAAPIGGIVKETPRIVRNAEQAEQTTAVGENKEVYKEHEGALIIEEDPDGGIAVGFDADNDGVLDEGEFLRGAGEEPGIDLTKESDFVSLRDQLRTEYNVELDREAISLNGYGEVPVSEYLNSAENTVQVSGMDWSRSASRASIGSPVALSTEGMDQYEINISKINGGYPEGSSLFIDLDGDGPGATLQFDIVDGKAIVPASVLDTTVAGNGGAAALLGTVRVGQLDGDKMITYASAFGKKLDIGDTLYANVPDDALAFTATDLTTGEGISQFAVNMSNEKISNLSDIFNGIRIGESDRLPSTFMVGNIDNQSDVTLANGQTIKDFDVRGGYHPEYDSSESIFKEKGTFISSELKYDVNGDGVLDQAEYANQLLVRTATNPYMLVQNASNYGIFEPERLSSLGIDADFLKEIGIADGIIDSESDANIMMQFLMQKENADWWDKVANETLNEMETQWQGATFDLSTVYERTSTYENSSLLFDTSNSSTPRPVVYITRVDENGDTINVGNQGWWARKYGADRVGNMTTCGQASIEKPGSDGSENSETSEGNESDGSENSETSEGTESDGSENSETSEGTESDGSETSEDTESDGSETSEGTESDGSETSEGTESDGSENSETTETTETTEISENAESDGSEIVEVTGKDPEAIEQNMGVDDGSLVPIYEPTPIGVTEEPVTFEPVTVVGGDTPVIEPIPEPVINPEDLLSDEEKAGLFEQFQQNH